MTAIEFLAHCKADHVLAGRDEETRQYLWIATREQMDHFDWLMERYGQMYGDALW